MKNINYSFLYFTFFLMLSNNVLSQNTVIDSLENELVLHREQDTTRVNNLDHLAYLYYRKDINKAKDYIEKAEVLARELKFKKGIANATYMRGVVAMVQSKNDESIEYFEAAAQIYIDADAEEKISGCYNGIGIIYSNRGEYEQSILYYEKALQNDEEAGIEKNIPHYITNIGINYMKTGKFEEAISNFQKSLALYTENNHTLGIANNLKNIAIIYQNQGNYPIALEYDNKALELAEKMQDSLGIANSLNNIGLIYKIQGDYDKALEYMDRSLAIKKRIKSVGGIAAIKTNIGAIYIKKEENHKAIKFLNESLEINRRLDSKSQITKCLNNLGFVHVSLKKYEDAYRYYEEAKNINIEIDDLESLSYSYLGIADSYMEQKMYNKALPNVLKSQEISGKLTLLDHQRDAYKLLSEIYKSNGEYSKALSNHEQYKIINDSLFNKENVERITQLEYEYKYKKALDSASIRELKLTKTVKATSQDLEKSQRNYLWAIIGFLLISILLGSIIFFQKYKNIISKNQNIVTEQKLLRLQMTPHFIFNSLSVLQGMILNKEDKKAVLYLSKFSKLLRITLENSRDKMVPLHQELTAVNNYLELQNLEVSQSYQYTILVDESIDESLLEIPPMLIQPFVENAIEHAFKDQKENRKIDIKLNYNNKKLMCTITDNGIGINAQKENDKSHKKSLATTITSERLKMLSKDFNTEGSITIEDLQEYNERGTKVTLVIPYKLVLIS